MAIIRGRSSELRTKKPITAEDAEEDDTLEVINGAPEEEEREETQLTVRPLNFQRMTVHLKGTAPFMQLRFSEKAMEAMRATQEGGQAARNRKERQPRDFEADYLGAFHVDSEGRPGIPCAAFRRALIRACSADGIKMTIAKMSLFIEYDALDKVDAMPLVWIQGKPEPTTMAVRNANGSADLRIRPTWREWSCVLTVRWDGHQFGKSDVYNLLAKAGVQVGVGEGRPFSSKSDGAGLGFGTWEIDPAHPIIFSGGITTPKLD